MGVLSCGCRLQKKERHTELQLIGDKKHTCDVNPEEQKIE